MPSLSHCCCFLCPVVSQDLRLEPASAAVLSGLAVHFRATVPGPWQVMTWHVGGLLVLSVSPSGNVTSSSEQFTAGFCLPADTSCVELRIQNVSRAQAGPLVCSVLGDYGSKTANLSVQGEWQRAGDQGPCLRPVPVGQVPAVGLVQVELAPVGPVPVRLAPVGPGPLGQVPLGQVLISLVPAVGQVPVRPAPLGPALSQGVGVGTPPETWLCWACLMLASWTCPSGPWTHRCLETQSKVRVRPHLGAVKESMKRRLCCVCRERHHPAAGWGQDGAAGPAGGLPV